MDLGTGGSFRSEIDILARLYDPPLGSREWFYRTWEVKVSLVSKDGTPRSLKIGKMRKVLGQLQAYREFGSLEVSLLDIYLCEAGFLDRMPFPPTRVFDSMSTKLRELKDQHFGYQILAFGHGKDGSFDVGVHSPVPPFATVLPTTVTSARQPFSRFVDRIDKFFEEQKGRRKSFNQIVFCRECRRLQMIRMKNEHTCPGCGSDLISQC